MVANAPRLQDDPQRADRVFGMLDADRNGSLSPEEFQRLAAMRGGSPPARPPAGGRGAGEGRRDEGRPVADRGPARVLRDEDPPGPRRAVLQVPLGRGEEDQGRPAARHPRGTRKGGDTGPAVVPGDLEESLLIQAVRYKDEDLQMPPKEKLPDAGHRRPRALGDDGRARPARRQGRSSRSGIDIEKGRQFWAFQPPKKSAPPAVKDAAWPRSDIDRFLLARLEAKGLKAGRRRRPAHAAPPASTST